jgi:TonB-linked SusC/RagA family outer membrane protein
MKKFALVISSRRYFYILMRVMKFRTLLLLFGTITFFTPSYSGESRIGFLNDVNYEELVLSKTKQINPFKLLADNAESKASVADQQKKVTGHITDTKGVTLTGVTILEKNTQNGVLSDANGNFSLNVASEKSVLVFTFIGFTALEVPVGSQSTINVTLLESTLVLEEVVIVGYGSQKKATITGAVSAVESAKLLQTPVANISSAIEGRVPGLLTNQVSGAPGQDNATLRIRGVGTFAGSTDPLVMIDGIEAQNYNNLDPNEIESISVLKDASATAVYGVRGANGVLLITTKRGKVGKPQVTFTSQYAISKFTDLREYMGSYDYAKGYNEALQYDSYLTGAYLPRYTAADIEHFRIGDDPLFHPSANWEKIMFKPYATQSQYNLNITGGTQRVKYFFSVGYLEQGSLFNDKAYDPGYSTEMKYNRYNFRSNFDFKITNRLTAKVNLSSQIENRRGLPNTSVSSTTAVGFAMDGIFQAPPDISPGVWDGKIVNIIAGAFYPNPMGGNTGTGANYFGQPLRSTYNNYLNGSIRFDYSLDFITKGLNAHASTSYQNFNSVVSSFSKTLVSYWAINLGNGKYELAPQTNESPFSFSESYGKTRQTDAEFGLDYSRSFGIHNFGGLLMYNQSKTYNPNLAYVVPHGFQGLVGRATYDYDKRYMAEFDFGYNGTENFAPGKRFGFFPAYSLGWVLSEEPFFPKNNIVTYAKVRGSYGEVGNDQIGGSRFLYNPTAYTFASTGGTNSTNSYHFGEVPGTFGTFVKANEGLVGNPVLTWEVAKKLDIGLDLTVIKDHIRITADYFEERRDNILTTPGTYPNTIGATFPAYNIGKMKNGGVDGDINYNDNIGKFHFWLKYTFTFTHNIIQYAAEAPHAWSYQDRTGLRNGQAFGYISEGIYNTWAQVNDAMRPKAGSNSNKIQPGDFIYKDVNGDGIVDSNDAVPLGYSNFPEQSYGFSFGGDFKGFDFSVLFQAAAAVTNMASQYSIRGWASSGSAVAYLSDRSWTWQKYNAGIATDFPHVSSSTSQGWNYSTSSFWLENDNYIRLKNLEIGYTISPRFLKTIGVESVHMYLNGSNLVTRCKLFQGEDPAIPLYTAGGNYASYPVTKTYNVGLSVKF